MILKFIKIVLKNLTKIILFFFLLTFAAKLFLKMKKTVLFIGLLLAFACNANAQEKRNYGFYLGCGINWMSLDKSFFYDDSEVDVKSEVIHQHNPDTLIVNTISAQYLDVKDAKMSAAPSFMIGGFFEYQATNFFGLQFELMYNQYGYRLKGYVEREESDGDITKYDYKSTTKLNNISAAVLLKFHLLKDHLNIDFGVQPSLCLRNVKDAQRAINFKEIYYTPDTDFKPFNVSLVGGVTSCIGEHIFIGARYNYGLIDILFAKNAYLNKDTDGTKTIKYSYSSAKSKTSSIQITVGYKF